MWQSHDVRSQACSERHLSRCREGDAAGRSAGGWRGRLRDAALRAHKAGRDLLHQRIQLQLEVLAIAVPASRGAEAVQLLAGSAQVHLQELIRPCQLQVPQDVSLCVAKLMPDAAA